MIKLFFLSVDFIPSLTKSGSAVATKSWRDVENPGMMMQSAHQGLGLLSPAPSVRLDGGIAAQTVEQTDLYMTDFSRHD